MMISILKWNEYFLIAVHHNDIWRKPHLEPKHFFSFWNLIKDYFSTKD